MQPVIPAQRAAKEFPTASLYLFGSPVITIASCLVDAVRAARNHTISEYLRLAGYAERRTSTAESPGASSSRRPAI